MTATEQAPTSAPPSARPPHRRAVIVLIPALVAGALLLIAGPPAVKARTSPSRITPAQAWPGAQRADIPGRIAGGPFFSPALFVDATTAVGTAPTSDGTAMRLLVRDREGYIRELRRLPMAADSRFDQVTSDGERLIWIEATGQRPLQIWTARLNGDRSARMLTSDTGTATFYGNQYDLVVAGSRVYWTAAIKNGERTEIRSVALTGGPVQVRVEPGEWALSAWPWLTDDAANPIGATRLLNMADRRTVTVTAAAAETMTCSPVWCRAMVMNSNGLDHIALVHPDGTGRRRVAGGGAQAAVADVALLDRFEILSEPGPDSDLTGAAALLTYDLRTGNTVDLAAAAYSASTRNGVLWWSTGEDDTTVWHSLDLRTA